MKQILTLCCLMCASVCWGQYASTPTFGTTDATAYLSTTNYYHALPTKSLISIAANKDGITYGLDYSGCMWTYTRKTAAYTSFPTQGCGWSEINVMTGTPNYPLMVGLLKVDGTCPSGTRRFYWWFGDPASAPSNMQICAAHWATGSEAAQVQIARTPAPTGFTNGHSFFWNGTSYLDIGTGWISGFAYNSNNACAVKPVQVGKGFENHLFTFSQGAFVEISPQPANAVSTIGCALDADGFVLAWGSGWVAYNADGNTWHTIYTPSAMHGFTMGTNRATILSLDASGNPYHLNVYPGYLSVHVSGSFAGCPDAQHPCQSGATHTATALAKFAQGSMAGAPGSDTEAPTVNMNANSFDFSNRCDVIFTFSGDNGCALDAGSGGLVVCNVTGVHLLGASVGTYLFSDDYVQWDLTKSLIASYAWRGNGWESTERCGIDTACITGTLPHCHLPFVDVTVGNRPSTKALQDQIAARSCQSRTPWSGLSVYYPQHPEDCTLVLVENNVKIPGRCD